MARTRTHSNRRAFVTGIAVAGIAGSMAVPAISMAVQPRTTTTIKACANKKSGVMRLTPPACKSTERSIYWNAQGAQGPRGLPGSSGLPGLAGTNGADGAPGPSGPPGPSGANGADGAPGPSGPEGPTGPAGASASPPSFTGTTQATSLPRTTMCILKLSPMPLSGSVDLAGTVTVGGAATDVVSWDVMDYASTGAFKQEIYASGSNPVGSLPFTGQASVTAGDRITMVANSTAQTPFDCSMTVATGTYTSVAYDLSD